MGTFKSAGTKKTTVAPSPRAGWPCVVIIILGVVGLFVFLFLVMKYAG